MTRSQTKLVRMALLVGVPILVLIGGAVVWVNGGRYVNTENAYVKADIAQVSPEVAGRVAEVVVRDHKVVKAGETLLQIDAEPYRLALDKAEADLDLARTQVETARAVYNETLTELGEVESQADYHDKQLARQIQLAGRGIVSPQKLEEVQNDANVARNRLSVVRRRLERVRAVLGGNPNDPADSYPQVRDKLAERNKAALDLRRTTIVAPVSGVPVNVKVQVGEQVKAATPLFVIVVDTRPWVEANLKETTLTHVGVGQKVKVVLDIYPDEIWDGVVDSISPATGSEFAILPPQNASGNWVKVVQRLPVKIRLLPHENESVLRAGMTATVDIDTERERSLGTVVSGLFSRSSAKAASR